MPSTLLATGLDDLVQATLRNLGKPNFTEIATDIQEFTALPKLVRKKQVTITGLGVQWDVMVAHSNSSANVGLGASDNVSIEDTLVQAQADWRNTVSSYAIIGQEVPMNQGEARIVDHIKIRRHSCMIGLAELMENNFWGPPVAATDTVTPWGINTWIVKNASEGFNGGAPSGYTTIGLNPTTYPRWKNWTAQYAAVTKDDLFRKLRKACTFTNFKPPVQGMSTDQSYGGEMGLFTNYGVIGPAEEQCEAQNDNLGNDLASKDGQVMFRRMPFVWVPKLEADTTNPVYGIRWGDFHTFILTGWWMKETNLPNYPGQHTMSAHFIDSTYNFVMKNRRGSFVIATGTSYPS